MLVVSNKSTRQHTLWQTSPPFISPSETLADRLHPNYILPRAQLPPRKRCTHTDKKQNRKKTASVCCCECLRPSESHYLPGPLMPELEPHYGKWTRNVKKNTDNFILAVRKGECRTIWSRPLSVSRPALCLGGCAANLAQFGRRGITVNAPANWWRISACFCRIFHLRLATLKTAANCAIFTWWLQMPEGVYKCVVRVCARARSGFVAFGQFKCEITLPPVRRCDN